VQDSKICDTLVGNQTMNVNIVTPQTIKDPESLGRAMSISIQLSVTNSFKTQTEEDPESTRVSQILLSCTFYGV
jgi:hypothetical protein